MQAVILTGGKGTRLLPYTTILPKPLMPVGEIPILEIIIRQLKNKEFKNIIFAVGYLKELIQAYFGNGEKWGINLKYSFESKPLGTAAPIKLINNLEDNFILMNGDILTNIDFIDLFNSHLKSKSLCTIATFTKAVKIDLGILEMKQNIITKYIEKPTLNYNVSMGIYVFSKKIIDFIPYNEFLDLPNLIKKLIQLKLSVTNYSFYGEWLDIGRAEDYKIAADMFEKHREKFL